MVVFGQTLVMNANLKLSTHRAQAAFTLIEVLMATLLTTISLVSLLGSISFGLLQTQISRENLRATQIMLEKMEGLRLYTFDQLTTSNMFPTTFTASYYPLAGTNQASGIVYYGQFAITDPGTDADYNPNMRLVTVAVSWTNANRGCLIPHTREMRTMVGRYGIQNYSFYN